MRTCVRGVICRCRSAALFPPRRQKRSARDGGGDLAGQVGLGAGCEGTLGSAPGILLTRRGES